MKKEHNIVLYSAVALLTFVLLFAISPDSYTHGAYNRIDSAWFFMCGKAWMNGMTPYVDFADSKGPLLWLIYGAGYLISHYDYHGVFWISWAWYVAIFVVTYRTAELLLSERPKAALLTILMTLAYFNPWFHYETRAEDFALLFLIISLHTVVAALYGTDGAQPSTRRSFFTLGVCFSALLLMKYNIAAMQLVFPAYLLYTVYKREKGLLMPLLWATFGFAAVILPFAVYFTVAGNFSAFVQEYFISTLGTVSERTYAEDWKAALNDRRSLALLAMTIAGSLLMASRLKNDRFFPLLSSLFVFALTVKHSYWPYYFNTCSLGAIWLPCYLLSAISWQPRLRHVVATATIVLAFCIVENIFTRAVLRPVFFRDYPEKEHFCKVSEVMSCVEYPTIINAGFHEFGYGLMAHALPGAKYWTLQNGAYPAMVAEHRREVLSGRSDFIFVYNTNFLKRANMTLDDIKQAGYRVCYEWGDPNDRHYLMTNITTD